MKLRTETKFALAACLVGFGLLGAALALAADQPPASPDQRHGEFQKACGSDLQTYCSTAKSREERHTCIEANKDKFSDSCKTFMAQHPRGQRQGQQGQSQPPTTNQ